MALTEQLMRYESSVVELDDGSLFQPLEQAALRWTLRSPCAFRALGYQLDSLYLLDDGRYVFVEYHCCRQERTDDGDLWVSDSVPAGRAVDRLWARRFLVEGQFGGIPDDLLALKARKGKPRQHPPEPAMREPDLWFQSGRRWGRNGGKAHEVNYPTVAGELRVFAALFVQTVRRWGEDIEHEPDSFAINCFTAMLFASFEVDLQDWLRTRSDIPPESIDLLDLRWPDDMRNVRDRIADLRRTIEVPLAAIMFERASLNDELRPSEREKRRARQTLVRLLPDLERAVQEFNRALGLSELEPDGEERTGSDAVFVQREGDWLVRFDGESAAVRDAAGMRHLRELLGNPDVPISVTILDAQHTGEPSGDGAIGPMADEQTLEEVHRRLLELREELSQAEADTDLARTTALQGEIGELTQYLQSATGLGGSARPAAADDKLRKKVSNRIDRAITAIRKAHRPLGAHLKKHVELGHHCRYAPGTPIDWQT